MQYIIIEDEKHNAALLYKYVQEIEPNAKLVGIIPSIAEAVLWFKENAMPDLVFMDIRLEDGLSFEIFNQMKFSCPIIFTTAYDEYSLQAFKVYGAAYLLKPIFKTELAEALTKIFEHRNIPNEDTLKALLRSFLANTKEYKRQFLIHYKDRMETIPVQEIDYIYLDNKSVYFNLKSGKSYIVPYTLEELEQQLNPASFFRVNRQYILSMESIDGIHKYFNEKAKVVLKNNKTAEILVSRTRLPLFKQWLDR